MGARVEARAGVRVMEGFDEGTRRLWCIKGLIGVGSHRSVGYCSAASLPPRRSACAYAPEE